MNVDQSEDRKLDELLRRSYAELRQTKADQRPQMMIGGYGKGFVYQCRASLVPARRIAFCRLNRPLSTGG